MVNYCTECGDKLDEETNVCKKCGTEIALEVQPSNYRKIGKIIGVSLIIAFCLLSVTILAGYIYAGFFDTKTYIIDVQVGIPLNWFRVYQLVPYGDFLVGVSNWLNFIFDLLI